MRRELRKAFSSKNLEMIYLKLCGIYAGIMWDAGGTSRLRWEKNSEEVWRKELFQVFPVLHRCGAIVFGEV